MRSNGMLGEACRIMAGNRLAGRFPDIPGKHGDGG